MVMPMPAYDEHSMRIQLEQMDNLRVLAFTAACCERLLPNYERFCQESKWGSVQIVRRSLDLVWSYLDGKGPHKKYLEKARLQCFGVTPDSDDFPSLNASLGQRASLSVCSLLDYLIDQRLSSALDAIGFSISSLDLYVQEIEELHPQDVQLERKILDHRLMQRELKLQTAELGVIQNAESLDSELLRRLKSGSIVGTDRVFA